MPPKTDPLGEVFVTIGKGSLGFMGFRDLTEQSTHLKNIKLWLYLNEKYPANDSLKPFYLFTYDSHKVNNLLKDEWLYDVYYVNYPLNIHISPRVYLYKVE
ncbi:hypothetical protein H6802_00465 [Candidatus Nomurabacteria bacterium]|uniref:Uncharacterized protein n=1 Tax=candidate division WWE3 bacterium TaxID=2053526 RepID=A0A955IX77_UNCKA|nr:hypothetical protein [candidate division WWE3 bacterium]MCB9823422.1 hypothetical protein [Candidatus Nomurabacteria bacterium]MCB9827704.1 hypothetical protein [Candidatus Nomurabacteria bacterium]HXK52832.1 hypothetical protein [bacterium]